MRTREHGPAAGIDAQVRHPGLSARFVFLVLAVVGTVPPAQAGPLRFFGLDTGAVATANSEVAYGSGVGVLFSNPALMSRFEELASVQLFVYRPELTVNLMDRPKAADITYIYYNSNVTKYPDNPNRPLPTIELRTPRADNEVDGADAYVGAGITYSFGIEGMRLGGLVHMPAAGMVSAETYYPDEREQSFTNTVHFARFGEWSKLANVLVGASYAPVKWASFGASLQGTASTATTIDVYIPEATVQDYFLVKNRTIMAAAARPILGIQVEPLDFLAAGLVLKWRSYLSVNGNGNMNLWNFHETEDATGEKRTVPKRVSQQFRLALDYEPMELTGGVGFRFKGWQLQGAATWNRWSDYRDGYGAIPQDTAVYPDGTPAVDGKHFAFSDTLSLNAGVIYRYLDHFEAKAGFAYLPSPVPAQTGRTNFADADLFCAALGHRFDFSVNRLAFFAEIGAQLWWLSERTTYKDPLLVKDEFPDDSVTLLDGVELASAKGLQTNNPGYPGFIQKGWMLVTAASLGFKL
ncbi:MAG: outer membrane protein transport protein [Deltaproteobacteria bacterium]|nr:outer membrane protein transport protein [Deltaproteobacteria bacterium]